MPWAIPGLSAGGLPVAANLKLPLNDLNELDPRTWPDEFAQRMTVLAKMPVELWAKYDFYFKDEIRKDFVPAPSWATDPRMKEIIEGLPGGGKVKMIYDRKSGKMVPGWSWRVDKIARLIPFTGTLLNVTTPGKSRHAQGKLAAAGYLAGPRPFALDPVDAATQRLFDKLDDLQDEQAALKQAVEHRSGEPWGGRIKELGKEIAKTQAEIARLDQAAGFDSPRFGRAKKKAKRKSYGVGSGKFGGSGGKFGGSGGKFGGSGGKSSYGSREYGG